MVLDTIEMGPRLQTTVPDFALPDGDNNELDLSDLMGQQGLLLAFVDTIWQPASIRRILYLQRHYKRFKNHGIEIAIVIGDTQQSVWSFHMSSPTSVLIPLLADENLSAHQMFNMRQAGLVFLDCDYTLRSKWLVPDERIWPSAKNILNDISYL
jgi:peroxiredoxin